ncbi:WD repeat-containing protein 89 [Chytridiales sp. JEL 0842]|nr:WD repeat-containing protein 89 [Chytridiales sp. JEL 0842]
MTSTFRLINGVQKPNGYVLGIVPSPCKRYVAVPYGSGAIDVLDVETLQSVGTGFASLTDAAAISDVQFVKNGSQENPFLVWISAMDGNLGLLDLRSGNLGVNMNDDALYQVIKADSIHKIGFFGPSYEYIYYQTHIETFGLHKFEDADVIKTYGDIRSLSTPEHTIEYLIDTFYEPVEQRLYLFSGTQSGNMGILNVGLDCMELVHTLNGGHIDIIRGAFWKPEAGTMLTGAEDGRVCVWKNI